MADHDPTVYDARYQAMEEVHFARRCIVCCIVALSPQHLEFQHLLAMIVSIITFMVPLGLNVTNATSHSIYNVGHGSQKLLSR